MGRKGSAGSPPADDADARKRIVDAALRCIERQGPAQTTLSDVAVPRTWHHKTDGLPLLRTTARTSSSPRRMWRSVASWPRSRGITSGIDDATGQRSMLWLTSSSDFPTEPLLTLLMENDRKQPVQPPDAAAGRDRTVPSHLAAHPY